MKAVPFFGQSIYLYFGPNLTKSKTLLAQDFEQVMTDLRLMSYAEEFKKDGPGAY